MESRLDNVNFFVLTIVFLYILAIQKFLIGRTVFGGAADQAIAYLSSVGFYGIVHRVLYWLINGNEWLLKLFWGRDYLKGVWTYSYASPTGRRTGIWVIDQNVHNTTISGRGVDNGKTRSEFVSIGPPIERLGRKEIIFERSEADAPQSKHFSRTVLIVEDSYHGWFWSFPVRMRASSVFFGLPSNPSGHVDVTLLKEIDAETEFDATKLIGEV